MSRTGTNSRDGSTFLILLGVFMEWIEVGLGIRIPKHVYDLGPAELVHRIHGITCGQYECPSCGRVYVESDYPSGQCTACRCPLPRVCVHKTCDNVVEPLRHETESGSVMWYEPTLDCSECQKFQGRAQRAAYIESITPPHIHRELGSAYYWDKKGRGSLDESLKGWFTSERCGEASRVHMIYVYGREGVGKSVGVMYHAAKNHLGLRVKGLFYVTEEDLLLANANKYADRREDKERAASLFAKCSRTELLVVDDLGGRPTYRQGQAETIGRVLGERLRMCRPTIVIGRREPVDGSPFSWVPGQLSGAFRSAGRSCMVWS